MHADKILELIKGNNKTVSTQLDNITVQVTKADILEQVSINRTYLTKRNKIDSNIDLSIRYGKEWNKLLETVDTIIDELSSSIVVPKEKISGKEYHQLMNDTFSTKNIAVHLSNKNINEEMINHWLKI